MKTVAAEMFFLLAGTANIVCTNRFLFVSAEALIQAKISPELGKVLGVQVSRFFPVDTMFLML